MIDERVAETKLRRIMSYPRLLVGYAVLIACIAACERTKQSKPADSAATNPQMAVEGGAAAPASNWDRSAGPVLLVMGELPAQAIVVPSDSATAESQLAAIPRPASVTLLGRGGTVQVADLEVRTDTDLCHPWSLVAAPPPRPWNVGFIGGVVAPLPMDSLEAFSRADSTLLVATVIRLASALPNDAAGRFSGLPFSARAVWRFNLPSGRQVVVATLARQINQEATPLQERTLLVAERAPITSTDSSFSTVYSERSYGDEDSVETREVLAAAELGAARRPTIVVARDFGDAVSFGFIERGADGRWRPRWSSARHHC